MSADTADSRNRLRLGRSAADKYLTFQLAGEHYGLPILKVREIIALPQVTPVPRLPAHVRGVVNLRGKVIPVIDLRLRFALAVGQDDKRTCVMVVQVKSLDQVLTMGVVVDRVSEVRNIPPDSIEPPPALGHRLDTAFITGVGKVGTQVVILLDVDKVLDPNELAQVRAASA